MMRSTLLLETKNRKYRNSEIAEREIRPSFLAREDVQQSHLSIENTAWSENVDWFDKNLIIDDHENFDQAMNPIIKAVQFFGIFPVCMNPKNSKTSTGGILSFRTLYSLTVIILLIMRTSIALHRITNRLKIPSEINKQGGVINVCQELIFCLYCTVSAVILLWISTKWIDLMKEWKAMEKQLNSTKEEQPQYRKKFYTISCLVMIPAAIEHLFAILNNIWTSRLIAESSRGYFDKYIEAYTFQVMPDSFHVLFAAIVLFIVQEIGTLAWNFTDLFIMLVSIGLAERYEFLNKAAFISIRKKRFSIDWLRLRNKYTTLRILVVKTDKCISPLIFLSFGHNIYSICLQLYNGIVSPKNDYLEDIYFIGSLCFLMGRTIAVTLFAAKINDQSKLLLPEIYRCPTSNFTIDTLRLQNQLATSHVALTGMKFFSITRKTMITVVSAVVTYEVVLLQANQIH